MLRNWRALWKWRTRTSLILRRTKTRQCGPLTVRTPLLLQRLPSTHLHLFHLVQVPLRLFCPLLQLPRLDTRPVHVWTDPRSFHLVQLSDAKDTLQKHCVCPKLSLQNCPLSSFESHFGCSYIQHHPLNNQKNNNNDAEKICHCPHQDHTPSSVCCLPKGGLCQHSAVWRQDSGEAVSFAAAVVRKHQRDRQG